MDKLEPIRRAFRQAGLYQHAADDLLCQRLAEAISPAISYVADPLGGGVLAVAAPPAALAVPEGVRDALAALNEALDKVGLLYGEDADDPRVYSCCLQLERWGHSEHCWAAKAKSAIAMLAQQPAAAVPAGYVPVSALIEAREEVESWAAYASPHFQDKHDLAGTLAKMDAQIAAAARKGE